MILREHQDGNSTAAMCREHGSNEATGNPASVASASQDVLWHGVGVDQADEGLTLQLRSLVGGCRTLLVGNAQTGHPQQLCQDRPRLRPGR